MWNTNIVEKSWSNGELKVTVVFSNGTDKSVKTFDVTSLDDLNRRVLGELAVLVKKDEDAKVITIGTFTPTEEPIITVTPEQQARNEWFRDFQRLEALSKLDKLGALKPALVADLDALRTEVADNFKKAYIADM